jgi:hypothetical protein
MAVRFEAVRGRVVSTSSTGVDPLISRLLTACPELEEAWTQERTDDQEEPLPYLQASTLAQVVAAAYSKGQTACFAALFSDVESLVITGTPEEQELVVAGFLEDLQGAMGWAGLEADAIREWLGPKSRDAWDGLIEMWKDIAKKKASGELPPGPFDTQLPDMKDSKLMKIFRSIQRPPT